MSDWPGRTESWGAQAVVIGPLSNLSLGSAHRGFTTAGMTASAAWPAANRAILVPFRLPVTLTAYQMVVGCGVTAAGNFDCGIYDRFGNRMVSGGATAKPSSDEAVVNIADTVLGPGVYYMAVAADGTNNYATVQAAANVFNLKATGVRQASAAYVLPATVTFETMAAYFCPNVSVVLRSE